MFTGNRTVVRSRVCRVSKEPRNLAGHSTSVETGQCRRVGRGPVVKWVVDVHRHYRVFPRYDPFPTPPFPVISVVFGRVPCSVWVTVVRTTPLDMVGLILTPVTQFGVFGLTSGVSEVGDDITECRIRPFSVFTRGRRGLWGRICSLGNIYSLVVGLR